MSFTSGVPLGSILPRRILCYSLLGLLLIALAAQTFWSMKDNPPIMDELAHLTTGFIYVKTGKFKNLSNPPLISQMFAWPLLCLGLDLPQKEWFKIQDDPLTRINFFPLAVKLIFRNNIPSQTIFRTARCVALALSCLFALILFLTCQHFWNQWVGLAAVFLYVTFPPLIAHSFLIMVDLALAMLFFLSLLSLRRLILKPNDLNALIVGLVFGITMATKVSGVLLFVFSPIVLAIHWFKNRSWAIAKRHIIVIGMVALSVLIVVFLVTQLPSYIHNLRYIFGTAVKRGFPSYLFGQVSSKGWIYSPLVIFMLKTPLPTIVLMILGGWQLAKWRDAYFFTVPVTLYFILACFSKIQGGIRHLLPIYPILFIGAALALVDLLQKRKTLWIGLLLMSTLAVEEALTYPNYIAYISAIAGGPDRGWKLIDDLDYGQDVQRLSDYLRQQTGTEFIVSLEQYVPLQYLGITAQEYMMSGLHEDSLHVNSLDPKQELLAVNIHRLLFAGEKFRFLERKQPIHKIEKTIFIYDIIADLQAHEQMAQEYAKEGFALLAEREKQRVRRLLKK